MSNDPLKITVIAKKLYIANCSGSSHFSLKIHSCGTKFYCCFLFKICPTSTSRLMKMQAKIKTSKKTGCNASLLHEFTVKNQRMSLTSNEGEITNASLKSSCDPVVRDGKGREAGRASSFIYPAYFRFELIQWQGTAREREAGRDSSLIYPFQR